MLTIATVGSLLHCAEGQSTQVDRLADASSIDPKVDASPKEDGDAPRTTAPCPDGGAVAIRVGAADASFCIDSTEVTRAQYAAFLATNPSTAGQSPECTWNATYVPSDWADGGSISNPDHPVAFVDWCDALAYCKSVGKRLCGAVGGGPATFDRDAGAATSGEWYAACSYNGEHDYPYGAAQDTTACNGPDGGASAAVRSFPKCQGGYPGLYDMAGNVQEWRDACKQGDAGREDDFCLLGGGSYGTAVESQSCSTIFRGARRYANKDLGIRCCAP